MITMTEHHDEYHDEYNDEYNGRAQMLQHCDQDECGDGDSFKWWYWCWFGILTITLDRLKFDCSSVPLNLFDAT